MELYTGPVAMSQRKVVTTSLVILEAKTQERFVAPSAAPTRRVGKSHLLTKLRGSDPPLAAVITSRVAVANASGFCRSVST